jgi:copper resistance protein C
MTIRAAGVRALLAVLLATLAVGLWPPIPAAAHAALVDTRPGADETTEGAPDEVVLVFNEAVAEPAEVSVTGPDGDDVGDGDHVIEDEEVAQPVDIGADGAYEVTWRVVSADGHPIDGELAFTVAGADDESDDGEGTETDEPEAEEAEPEPDPEPDLDEAAEVTDEGGSLAPWLIGGLVLALLVGGGVWVARSRGEETPDPS